MRGLSSLYGGNLPQARDTPTYERFSTGFSQSLPEVSVGISCGSHSREPKSPTFAKGVVVDGQPVILSPAELRRAPLRVRLLVDRSIVEAFLGGGRIVATARDYPAADEVAARVWTSEWSAPLEITSVSAWSMGCGWV